MFSQSSFKQTPVGPIPKEWDIKKVGDMLSLEYGKGLPERERIQGEYPVVGSNGILGYHDRALVKGPGIVVGRKGTIGAVTWIEQDFWPIDTTYFVKTKASNISLKWLFYELTYLNPARFYLADVVPGLKRELVYSSKIPRPPLPEQRRIAEILSTVDEAIQRVNEAITKTERLKRGLMQELLTKGIGHKEFKDTEIGRIPKDWEVVRLEDDEVAEIRRNKVISDVDKVAFIPMELVPDIGLYAQYQIRNLKDVSSSTYCEAGDLLLAKITPSFENGKQGIVPSDVPNGFALATTEVYPISCKGINRLFLFYILKFPKFRKILEFSMRGTTGRQRVPKEAVEKLRIPFPQISEQQKIAEILSTVDKKLELERKRKEKLERIKRGLMNDLLTGKVRVKIYRKAGEIEPLLQKIKKRLEEIYGEKLKHVFLYGSFARGVATEDSDIDIAVVLDKLIDRAREIDRLRDVLYEFGLESGEVISVYPLSKEELENESWPLYYHIREGVKI